MCLNDYENLQRIVIIRMMRTFATMAFVSLGTWVLTNIISNLSCEKKQ